jgi:hypothetical protein
LLLANVWCNVGCTFSKQWEGEVAKKSRQSVSTPSWVVLAKKIKQKGQELSKKSADQCSMLDAVLGLNQQPWQPDGNTNMCK